MFKLSHKIIFSFIALSAISLSAIFYADHIAQNLNKTAQFALTDALDEKALIDDMRLETTEYFAILESTLTLLDLEVLSKKMERLDLIMKKLAANADKMNRLYPHLIDDRLKTLQEDLDELHRNTKQTTSYVRVFAQTQALNTYQENVDPLQLKIRLRLENKNQRITEKVNATQNLLKSQSSDIIRIRNISFFILSLTSVLLIIYLWRNAIVPIGKFTNFVSQNPHTQTGQDTPFIQRPDEIGALAVAFEKMIHARNQAEEELNHQAIELRNARDQAQDASRAKMEFLANMSHEIRTPLNGIMGMVQLINMAEIDDKNQKKISAILKSAELLLKIVNDVLDFSKIEAKQIILERTNIEAHEIISITCDSLEPLAQQKNLSFIKEIDIPEDLVLIGDPTRLKSILNNLIGNAIRYTDEGSVSVKAQTRMLEGGKIELAVDIVDTGLGISEDAKRTIFEKFTQADTSTTRRYGGTGLGLAITKELIQLMRGTLNLESTPGKGSTFSIHIPFDTPIKDNKTQSHSIDLNKSNKFNLESFKILIAEDNEMNQNVMIELFDHIGVSDYEIVKNGLEALQAVKEKNYNLIFMDCHMPEMNGYDSTKEIRNLPDEIKSKTPIIAMTGDVVLDNDKKCKQAGMNEFIAKPFKIEEIETIIASYGKNGGQNHQAQA